MQSGASGSSASGNLGLFRQDGRNRRVAQRRAHQAIGCDIDIRLPVAIRIDPANLDRWRASQRPSRDRVGQLDSRAGQRGNHRNHGNLLGKLECRAFKMGSQGRLMIHRSSPLKIAPSSMGRCLTRCGPLRGCRLAINVEIAKFVQNSGILGMSKRNSYETGPASGKVSRCQPFSTRPAAPPAARTGCRQLGLGPRGRELRLDGLGHPPLPCSSAISRPWRDCPLIQRTGDGPADRRRPRSARHDRTDRSALLDCEQSLDYALSLAAPKGGSRSGPLARQSTSCRSRSGAFSGAIRKSISRSRSAIARISTKPSRGCDLDIAVVEDNLRRMWRWTCACSASTRMSWSPPPITGWRDEGLAAVDLTYETFITRERGSGTAC